MKKVLIIATAFIFAVSVSTIATAQNAAAKTQPQKASTTVTKQEVKKAEFKTEPMASAKTIKKTQSVKHKSHKKMESKAAPSTSAVKKAGTEKTMTPAKAPAKKMDKKK